MADYDTPTNCTLLTVWNDDPAVIDHWVASHQILPFFATIYGWDFRSVLVAVYVVETVENFVWCLERAYTEDFANTSISDPIQGIIGVLLGYIFKSIFGSMREEKYFLAGWKNTAVTLFDVGCMVVPSAIFYSNRRELDYLYLLLFPMAFFIVSRHEGKHKLVRFLVAYGYVVTTCGVVFGHPLKINSFYAAWISSFCVGICLILFHVHSTPKLQTHSHIEECRTFDT
jgi:hypothetical protein